MSSLFHSSIEGAQHTPKGLDGFLQFALNAGAFGCQPSNFMLDDGEGGFTSASLIRHKFASSDGALLDGISAHCPFWVHTTAWTGSPTIRPFLPKDMVDKSPAEIEQWAEDYILRLFDLCDELEVKVVPMFWGIAFGWEVATGYPWGFWAGDDYDLIEEGKERFVTSTANIRDRANQSGIKLCHEIHPGTAAVCGQDFLTLVEICDDDECICANADPSHCWEGESWQDRFEMPGIAERIFGCHVKNHHVRPGLPVRCMEPDWQKRPMQFCQLDRGDLDMVRYAELMIRVGYPQRYCALMSTKTAPLSVEAEGAYASLDTISADGVRFVTDECCFEVAEGSFEDGMGDQG